MKTNSKSFEDCLTLDTGRSDSRKLITTPVKTKHEFFPLKIVKHRDYKNFDTKVFKNRLELILKNTTSFEVLQEIFMYLCGANHSKFMTNELIKAKALRMRFKHQFWKMKTSEAKAKYNKQKRNICVSLTRKTRRNYYENFELNNIYDNRKFWANVKPIYSNKIKSVNNLKIWKTYKR